MSKTAGGKSKKAGRCKLVCRAYAAFNRRERNKVVKLNRHLKRFPDDNCAKVAADRAKVSIRGY